MLAFQRLDTLFAPRPALPRPPAPANSPPKLVAVGDPKVLDDELKPRFEGCLV